MIIRQILTIGLLASLWSCGLSATAQEPGAVPEPPEQKYNPQEDEEALKKVGVETDDEGLLSYFEDRILPEKDREKVEALIKQLANEDFDVRLQATAELRKMGNSIELYMEKARESKDPEVVYRAGMVLSDIRQRSTPELMMAAIRLLAHRNPERTTTVLLQHAPLLKEEDELVIDTLLQALVSLAKEGEKINPALQEALQSSQPQVRALAGSALIRSEGIEITKAKELLRDRSPVVKLWAALGLVEREEKEAIEVLINTLPEIPVGLIGRTEMVLYHLAGTEAPEVIIGEHVSSRIKARDAWKAWWKKNEAKIDLADLKKQPKFLGLTLLAMRDNRGQGTVAEIGRNGKIRWEIRNLRYPMDAQLLPNGNVLIAERSSSLVTERNQKGQILWRHSISSPVACYRRRDGSTMIAGYREMLVLDRNKKVVLRYRSTSGSIYAARPLPRGGFVLLTSNRSLIHLNSKGVLQRTIPVNGNISSYCSISVLPNGNYLVPLYTSHRVVELDPRGRTVKTFSNIQYPTTAQRLPNGRTLIGSYSTQRLQEVNAAGKVVKTTMAPGRLWHAHRR